MPLYIIVTSGPTREYFDPIRFLSNPSTGKMGYYIAKAAIQNSHKVVFISGTVSPEHARVQGAKNISVISTQDMLNAVLSKIREKCVLLMSAAPADFKPAKMSKKKLKKVKENSLSLVRNPDILLTVHSELKKRKIKQIYLAGFAAETHKGRSFALKKLKDKHLDIIFLNDLSRKDSGFGKDTSMLTLFRKDGSWEKWKTETKEKLGHKIIQEIEKKII